MKALMFRHFPISVFLSVMLFELGWSTLGFCGEIHDAAKNGDAAKVKQLLEANPDLVFSKDESDYDSTALHYAARNGHKDVAEVLLAHKANINAKNKEGATPLFMAAGAGSKDMVEFLLANKAEVNSKAIDGEMPLHAAAAEGYKDIVELLLANKADVNAKDNAGHTPLDWAANKGHGDVVELLRLHGSLDPNVIRDSTLNGDLKKVKALIKDNPTLVFHQDGNGDTPLIWAALRGHKDVVEFLLASGAKINATNNAGETPLHLAAGKGYKDVVELLLAHGAGVNFRDSHGHTPLELAAAEGYKVVMELLLANKANVNAKNNAGATPLHFAAKNGQKDVAMLLLASGADINVSDNHGQTPLHIAAAMGHKDVADFLLANKAEVNSKDNNGQTPLHYAMAHGQESVAELLRKHGGREQEFDAARPSDAATEGHKIGALPASWPAYTSELTGLHEVRVKNPNDFNVRVGLRSNDKGKDFIVSPNGVESVNVPNGRYDIYFNYSSDPSGLYQGDSFSLNDNGVEITITKVVNGNYGIRKVK
jgi:cytohesin